MNCGVGTVLSVWKKKIDILFEFCHLIHNLILHIALHFINVFTFKMSKHKVNKVHGPVKPLKDVHFTMKNIENILVDNIKMESPAGPEGVPPIFYKKCATAMTNPLFSIYQSCLIKGECPTQWKNAKVTPIYTKGEKEKLSNHRPISFSSVGFKVFERILTNQIIDYLKRYNLLRMNHGLLSDKSLLTDNLDSFEEKDDLDIIHLEWKNAYESIPHNHLFTKLEAKGISGKVLKWIKDFLKNQTQTVEYMFDISEPLQITSGVPRESILGRILFLIYIDDMFEGIQSDGKLFTDYFILFKSIKSPNDKDILQKDLLDIQKWSCENSIQLFERKCIVKNQGLSNPKYDYSLNNVQIEKWKKDEDFYGVVRPEYRSSKHNRIARRPIYDNSDVADKSNFSNLCEIYDHVFSNDTRYPIYESDSKMNIEVTDLVSFGDLEDAVRVSTEKIPVGGTIVGTIHTVRHFHPGVYRCTRVIPFEDHEPVFIYHHASIDPAKIIRQSLLMMSDFNEYNRNVINYINRYDWTWGNASSDEDDDDEYYDDEDEEEFDNEHVDDDSDDYVNAYIDHFESGEKKRLLNWLKKKRMADMGKDQEEDKDLYEKRKRFMYFASYENASRLKECVKKKSINYSDISSSHFTVTSSQLMNRPIAMAAEVVCKSMPEQWKMGKAFQDISTQKYFALLIHNYAGFMYGINELIWEVKDSSSRLGKRYPEMQFTSVEDTKLMFNMADFVL